MTTLLNETVMLFAAARQQLDNDQLTHEKDQQMNNENTNVIEHTITEDFTDLAITSTFEHQLTERPVAQTVAIVASPEAAGALYAAGKTVIEVSRELGVTYAKATKLIKTSGTPIRNASDRLKGRTRSGKNSVDA